MSDTQYTIPDSLRQFGERALANARRELQRTGSMEPVFAFEAAGRISKCPINLGPFLNNGPAKDLLFPALRGVCEKLGATGAVFVNDGWFGRETEKFKKLAHAERERIMSTFAFPGLIESGYFTREEALTIVAQTTEAVLTIHQFYQREEKPRRITFIDRVENIGPQELFDGRFKMFGAQPSPSVFHKQASK